MLLGGKINYYMEGNLLGTFDAVQNDIPITAVAAIFQKDPQIFMTHPEAGVKTFADLAKVPTHLHRRRPLRHRLAVDEGGLSGLQGRAAQALSLQPRRLPRRQDERQPGLRHLRALCSAEKEGGFTPDVFLMADAGYTTYSTMIAGMTDYVDANPDVTKRFVEASIVGWYNYLYGDNKAANDLIKPRTPT